MVKFEITKLDIEYNYLNKLLTDMRKLASLHIDVFFEEMGIYEILTRPRMPEEIFHLLNFSTLNQEFNVMFELLAKDHFIRKQGEFYVENKMINQFRERTKRELEREDDILEPLDHFFEYSLRSFKAILNGDQGKLNDKKLRLTLDSLYGTKLFFLIRQYLFKQMKSQLSVFKTKSNLNLLNWGIGSGYEALHMADYYGDKVSIISVEPNEGLRPCRVLQDIYGIYNVHFEESKDLTKTLLKDSVDFFIGNAILNIGTLKDNIKKIKDMLVETGSLVIIMDENYTKSIDWALSIHKDYVMYQSKEETIQKLKHYGFSKVTYLDSNKGFIVITKS